MDEGYLTKKRSILVNKKNLSIISNELKLIRYAFISKSIDLNIKSTFENISSDLYESIIGAIFLDSNYENTRIFVQKTLIDKYYLLIDNINNKGQLNELCHFKKINLPLYATTNESGPIHNKRYESTVTVNNLKFIGEGFKIKDAENHAAFLALQYFNS